jgi:hypothetical protein
MNAAAIVQAATSVMPIHAIATDRGLLVGVTTRWVRSSNGEARFLKVAAHAREFRSEQIRRDDHGVFEIDLGSGVEQENSV